MSVGEIPKNVIFDELLHRKRVCFTPGAQVRRVQPDAKNICGNEAILGGAHADHANQAAIDCCEHPALPATPSYEDCGANRQDAGQIIQLQPHCRSPRNNSSMRQTGLFVVG